jgi:broad specificity phosphatase PhoE
VTIAKLAVLGWVAPAAERTWSSPEKRVQQTAIALNLNPLEATELRECDYGTWSGRSLEEIHAEDPSGLASWLTDIGASPHGGESFRALMSRVGRWIENQRETGHSIVVTHTSVVRAAIVYALAAPEESFRRIEVAPLTLTELRLSGPHWHLRIFGASLGSPRDDL